MNRKLLRNKITGFAFGKYDLLQIGKSHLKGDEEYISGTEIIFYNETLIFLSIIQGILSLVLSFGIHLGFIILLVFAIIQIYFSLDLELIILTNERVVIEKRSLFEKLLHIQNITSISVDQIAMYTYSRAPFHRFSLMSGLIGVIVTILTLAFSEGIFSFLLVLTIPFYLYLFWFGLRLNRRSIELHIIGVSTPFGMGRWKGIPMWFLNDLQMVIIERIHHLGHNGLELEAEQKMNEFPLENASSVKNIIRTLKSPIEKEILRQLELVSLSKRELRDRCKDYEESDLEGAMMSLRMKKLIFYNRSSRNWSINIEQINQVS